MKKLMTLILAAMLLLGAVVAAAESSEGNAILVHVEKGSVTVTDPDGNVLPVEEEMAVPSGCVVETGEDSYAYIYLDDSKVVKLDVNTVVTVSRNGGKAEVELQSGQLMFNLEAPLADGEEFIIRMPTMMTSVEGSGAFSLGNALHGYGSEQNVSLIYVYLRISEREKEAQQYCIGRIALREQFRHPPVLTVSGKTLSWDHGYGFIGGDSGDFKLLICEGTEYEKTFDLQLDETVIADNLNLPLGEYRYQISKRSVNLFSTQLQTIASGKFLVGDENELRFLHHIIQIDSITFEDDDQYETECRRYNGTQTEKVAKYVSTKELKKKQVWKREWFDSAIDLPFEFLSIPVPAGYEEILDLFFGDWRTPLQISSGHGGMIFDTSRSYIQYLGELKERQ